MKLQRGRLAVAGVAIAGSTLGFMGVASASSSSDSLANEIAQKFHLNSADVQQVITQHRQAHRQKHDQNYQDRLSAAVSSGKITADQKTQILAKHAEYVALVQSLKSASATDRKTQLQQKRKEIRQWAKQNNIPAGLLGFRDRYDADTTSGS